MCKSVKERLDNVSSSEENLQELYSIFNSIDDFSLPIIRFYIDKGAFVVRQRINPQGKDFSSISELSYPPSEYCTDYGRANLKGHSMFYCCSFATDENAPEPRYTTLLETSKFIWDKESKGIERATCSRWDVIEKLNLLALPFSQNYERTFDDIVQIQEEWEKEVQKKGVNKDGLALVEYMSEEIAKNVNNMIDYFKIANFIYYLLYMNKKTMDSDGIIYPSVAAAGEGFNVVLKPDVVDKKLRFHAASLCYLIKDGMQAGLYVVNHSEKPTEDGQLNFIPQKDFDIHVCDGYEFRN